MDTVILNAEEYNKAENKTELVYDCELSCTEVSNFYSDWAKEYDKHLNPCNYRGPAVAAEACKQFFFDVTDQQRVQILDVAAGTGLLGQRLKDYGFSAIDALDPSEGMLELARTKNIYRDFICEFLSEKQLPIQQDKYDCITLSGGMGDGHIPPEALYELIRITKPGGYIIIAMREEFLQGELYKDKLEPLMDKLVDENKWKKIDREFIDRYSFENRGILFKYCVV